MFVFIINYNTIYIVYTTNHQFNCTPIYDTITLQYTYDFTLLHLFLLNLFYLEIFCTFGRYLKTKHFT